MIVGAVILHKSAGNRVNNAERFCIGRAIRLDGAAEDFDRWRCREFFSRNRIELDGSVKESCTPSPAWCAARSLIATGTGGVGGTGSPGAPHPPASKKMENRKQKMEMI